MKKNILLSKIKGCFCASPTYYDKFIYNSCGIIDDPSYYSIIKLKEDIKTNGLQEKIIILDFKEENLEYRYYVEDGNNRLRIIKDLTLEQGKKLEEESIPVIISDNKKRKADILRYIKNGDLDYNLKINK